METNTDNISETDVDDIEVIWQLLADAEPQLDSDDLVD